MLTSESWRTDWLGLPITYYDTRTGRVSRSLQTLLAPRHRWDAEGLRDYLHFGFSVFGATPFEGIRFLLPCQELVGAGKMSWQIRDLPDPLDELDSFKLSEGEILGRLRQTVRETLRDASRVCLPLSGGLDSRLLATCLHDDRRVRAFTYGVSERQYDSTDAIWAREVARRLSLPWHRIPLQSFLDYIPEWESLFGPAISAHGMYHFEFYLKIRDRLGGSAGVHVLSGLFGDHFAGKRDVQTNVASGPELFEFLSGITAGWRSAADFREMPNPPTTFDNANVYYERFAPQLRNSALFPAHIVRLAMNLLRFQFEVPRSLGFRASAPYLNQDVALPMLLLPADRRRDRLWVQDAFKNLGVDLESEGVPRGKDHSAIDRAIWSSGSQLEALDSGRLSDVIRARALRRVNDRIVYRKRRTRRPAWPWRVPKLRGFLRRVGWPDPWLRDFNTYMALHPLQESSRAEPKD